VKVNRSMHAPATRRPTVESLTAETNGSVTKGRFSPEGNVTKGRLGRSRRAVGVAYACRNHEKTLYSANCNNGVA